MKLTRVDTRPTVKERDVLGVFICTRNERKRLRQFLDHHRKLGANRFFFVDNGSTDGSVEFLLSQHDVHIWETSDSYRENEYGVKWLSYLLDDFAQDEWALILDADELLIYPGCEEFEIYSLCRYLDRLGSRVLRTIFLDMYSDRPISETTLVEDQNVLEVCPFFDRGPYARYGREDFGGVRQRVFWNSTGSADGPPPLLTNFPLQRWRRGTKLYTGRHYTDLPGEQFTSVTGALLHFKMMDSLVEQAAEEVKRKEHWNAASEYAAYAKLLAAVPNLTLFDHCSVKYVSSRQLVSMGLLAATGNFWKRCRREATALASHRLTARP